jgi:hypothetical protein
MLNPLARTLSGAALCCVLTGGCERPPETPPRAATPAATPATPPAPRPVEVMPRIVSVTPDTINVIDGRALRRSFQIVYEIDGPERVEKARVVIYARGIGEMQRVEVPVVPRGTVNLEVTGDNVDLGPTVRFRAVCPGGVTDWYTLGHERLPVEQQMSTPLQIIGVGPSWIEQSIQDIGGSAVRISVGGKGLTGECKLEAQVNRRTVELRNAFFRDKHWEALLLRSDLGERAVAARYLEVKFIVNGPHIGLEVIKHIRFQEPQ